MSLPGALADQFGGSGRIGLARINTTGNSEYVLLRHLNSEYYQAHHLTQIVGLPGGGQLVYQLDSSAIKCPWLSVTTEDVTVSRSGATWGRTTQTLSYGGGYRQSTAAGETMTFSTPVSADRLGVRVPLFSVGGISKVTIDGSSELANLLPTASEQVTLGRLASSVLVANGGTLNPQDRVLDLTPAAQRAVGTFYNFHIPLAEHLGLKPHVVTLTNTGYSNTGSTGTRLAIEGFSYGYPSMAWNDSGAELLTLRPILTLSASAHEYAHDLAYSNAAHQFTGCVHGWETQDSLSFVLDGVTQTLSDGQVVMGSTSLVVAKNTTLHNPADNPTLSATLASGDTTATLNSVPSSWASSGIVMIESEVISYTGKTSTTLTGLTRALSQGGSAQSHAIGKVVYITPGSAVATVVTTYTVTSDGMQVEYTTNWSADVTIYRSYAAMWPQNGWQLTHGLIDSTDYALTTNNPAADTNSGFTQSLLTALYQDVSTTIPDINQTCRRLITMLETKTPSTTVLNWTYAAPEYVFLQDRAPGPNNNSHIHKTYVTKVGSGATLAVSSGTSWTSSHVYRAALLENPNYSVTSGVTALVGRPRRGLHARTRR